MLFNLAARLSTAVILLRHPRTSADIAVWEFRTLAHLSLMEYPTRHPHRRLPLRLQPHHRT